MRRWIPQPWFQILSASPGTGTGAATASRWLGDWTQHGTSWRSLSSQPSSAGKPDGTGLLKEYGKSSAQAAPAVPVQDISDRGQAEGPLALLARFFESKFDATPPVSFIRSVGVPTALSWMRRRGPEVPHAVLHRLFRQRQVRLFDGEKIRRVSASRPLENGDLLLYPNWLRSAKQLQLHQQHRLQLPSPPHSQQQQLAAAARAAAAAAAAESVRRSGGYDTADRTADGEEDEDADGGRVLSYAAAGPGPGSRSGTRGDQQEEKEARGGGRQQGPVLTPERVRHWVLGVHPGLLFLNKPAGVQVHGRAAGDEPRGGGRAAAAERGGGMRPPVPQSLDEVMRGALRFGRGDEPRLVHRLDRAASGVMLVARNADAATWLCAAFRAKSEQALAGSRRDEEHDEYDDDDPRVGRDGRRGTRAEERPSIRRTYWAFLAGDLQPRQSGHIRLPVVVDGVACPALTGYRVRATGCGVSWVELTPETGRRHQLRIHCARKLGAPIIGDERYGYRGLPPLLLLRERLPPEWWALLGEDPRVVRRRREAAGESDPPPPPVLLHSRELLVRRPGRASLTAVAPLPRYIRQLIEAADWPAPAVG